MSETVTGPEAASPTAPPTPSTPPTQRSDSAHIRAVAKGQREVLWLLLARVLCAVGFYFFPPTMLLGMVFALLSIFAVYRLSRALNMSSSTSLIYSVGALLPLVGLLVLLVVNSQATGTLQARGLRVGLMGVSDKTLTASGV